MKNVFKMSVLVLLVLPNLFAQITLRDKNTINKINVKPIKFDSLSKISFQKKVIDYKKYIGQKLYFLLLLKNTLHTKLK